MPDAFAFAFFPDSINTMQGRIYQGMTAMQQTQVDTRLSAALPIPCGSTIVQLNVAYWSRANHPTTRFTTWPGT